MVGLLFKVVVGVLGVVADAAIPLHKTLGGIMLGASDYRLGSSLMSGSVRGGFLLRGTVMRSSLSGREYLPEVRVQCHNVAQRLVRIFQFTFV